MNKEPFMSAFQQEGYFNTYLNTSYSHQAMVTNDVTECTHQGVPERPTRPHGIHHPLRDHYPGTNQRYSRHPGPNPFLTPHPRMTHFSINHSGANQYTAQYPGNSPYTTLHQGQWHFGETHQPGGGAESRFLRNPPFPGRNPQFSGNMQLPFQTTQFGVPWQFQNPCPQTRFRNEIQKTNGRTWQRPIDNNDTTTTGPLHNFQFIGSMSSSAPNEEAFNENKPQTSPLVENSPFRNQATKTGQYSKLQERQLDRDGITNLMRIQHLISTYITVRNLVDLCRDFKTPVFGDFPDGNDVEKKIVKALLQFLKEEIRKVRFVGLEEREELMFDKCVEDPILRASFSVFEMTITRLEIKINDLQDERKKNEKLEKDTKAFSEELEVKEAKAKTLKAELGAEKSRWDKLSERLKEERKNNETTRLQFAQEIEALNQIKIHKLHEDLRALQEKISNETKLCNKTKEEIQIVKEENDSLRSCISELEPKN